MKKVNYIKHLDVLRAISCVSILLYHLDILKGGYLAVCTFFVLSGYLTCTSSLKKEEFSFKSYYKNLFLRIYLPLLSVVFITIFVLSFIPNLSLISLKPETTSIIGGYNNFWQLSANLDYFARHADSPFIHLWYISILIQFDVVWPLIYIGIKKLKVEFGKFLPLLVLFVLSIISTGYFYFASTKGNIMFVYYNSFSRVFSLLWGVFLAYLHHYYGIISLKRFKKIPLAKMMICLYLLVLILLFIFIDSKSKIFNIGMILATIVSLRIISYANLLISDKKPLKKFVKYISSISYEVYLVQYPVIYLYQFTLLNSFIKIVLMLITIFIFSSIIHFALNFKSGFKRNRIIKIVVFLIIIILSLVGVYKYIVSEDYTKEMKALENQLNENEKMMVAKQEEYQAKLKEEEEEYSKMLDSLEVSDEELKEIVQKIPVVGIGDSVLLGAVNNLYKKFPNGYFDGKVSRSIWAGVTLLQELNTKNLIKEVVVINLGANGDCSANCKSEIMKLTGDKKVFWLTVTNDQNVHVNDKLKTMASEYDNLYIIDWENISKGHEDYFYGDGIHLTIPGREAYTEAIYEAIYKVYKEEQKIKKENAIKEYEESLKVKLSFYGNDLLLNAFDFFQDDFENAKFNINKDYTFKLLKEELAKDNEEKTLNHRIVLAFDNKLMLNKSDYEELINIYKDNEINIVLLNNQELDFESDRVNIINFYDELKVHEDYLMVDKIHLTETGNKAFKELLVKLVNKED